MRHKAFTLIELLVVIAIIGILVSISVVGWVSVAQRGRDSTRKSDLARIKQVLQQQYSDTRTYPIFDNTNGLIYGAVWQLTTDGLECVHFPGSRLTPKYISEIPHDPKDSFDYASATCSNLAESQTDRYLYITPTDASGPIANPTSFALMATLERPGDDELAENSPFNQLTSPTTIFGAWYAGHDNYGNALGVTANYLVDSRNQ